MAINERIKGFLHADGVRIVDGEGKEVILRGWGAGNWMNPEGFMIGYENVRAFLEKIGYRGFSNIDMKYDVKTGRYLMFEINPRLGRSSYFVRTADINMMEELIERVVYHRCHDPIFGTKRAMWSNVPLGILKKYVKNQELQKEIRELSKECAFTLRCRDDFSLRRYYRISRFYFSHYKNFSRYYFQK